MSSSPAIQPSSSPAIPPSSVSITMVPISGPSGPPTEPLSSASLIADSVALPILSAAGAPPPSVQIGLQAVGTAYNKEAAATSAGSAVISIAGTRVPGSASIQMAEVRPLNGPVKAELQKHEGQPIEDAKEDLAKELEKVKGERTTSTLRKILTGLAMIVCIAAFVALTVLSGGFFGLAVGIVAQLVLVSGIYFSASSLESSAVQNSKNASKFESMDKAFKTPEGQKEYNDEIDSRMKFYKPAHDDNTTDAEKSKWKVTPEVYENIRAKEFVLKEIAEEKNRELEGLEGLSKEVKEQRHEEIDKTFAEKYKHARAKLDREEIDLFRDIGMVPKTPLELERDGLNPVLAAGKFHSNEPLGQDTEVLPLPMLDQADVRAQADVKERTNYYAPISNKRKAALLRKYELSSRISEKNKRLAAALQPGAAPALLEALKKEYTDAKQIKEREFQKLRGEIEAEALKKEEEFAGLAEAERTAKEAEHKAEVEAIRGKVVDEARKLAKVLDQDEVEFFESIGFEPKPVQDLDPDQRASLMPGQFYRNYLGTLINLPPPLPPRPSARSASSEEAQKKNDE